MNLVGMETKFILQQRFFEESPQTSEASKFPILSLAYSPQRHRHVAYNSIAEITF